MRWGWGEGRGGADTFVEPDRIFAKTLDFTLSWEVLWVELCPLEKRYIEVLTPLPQNMTLFKDRVFTEISSY